MRVSIVATALDGQTTASNTVLNMVSRIHNRNNGNTEGLFSQNSNIENNTFNSIDGATALKLDEKFEVNDKIDENLMKNFEPNFTHQNNDPIADGNLNSIPNGVSLENASYMENGPKPHDEENHNSLDKGVNNSLNSEIINDGEHTPQLFEEENLSEVETHSDDLAEAQTNKLFDKDSNEDEDFEIPAFLRKQKF
tara:strand:- start:10 stop:594 length:585 start_codon:yes stop_codon:yes gene_type:complete